MAAPLLTRKQQISVASGTEGTAPTWSNVETAANSDIIIYDPQWTFDVREFTRRPVRAQLGALASTKTIKLATLTFTTEVKGSGTAGVAPTYDLLLKACGMSAAVNTGSASIGTVYKNPNSTGSGAVPTVAGTYSGTKSGRLYITLETVTTDTSIVFNAVFYPADGTAPSADQFTQSSDSAVTLTGVAAGVTVDFGDPSSSTTGYVAGDNYAVTIVSDQQVDVVYTMTDTPTQVIDLSLGQGDTAGNTRVRRLYSAVGNWTLAGTVGEIGTFQWSFTGVYSDTVDSSLITGISYPDEIPPPFMNLSNVDLLGGSGCFTEVSISTNNTLANRLCATAATGVRSVRNTGREMTASINPEADLVANLDVDGLLSDGTTAALDFQLGSTSGNIVVVECPRAQVMNVSGQTRDDIIADGLDLKLTQPEYSGTNEYSEISITFK